MILQKCLTQLYTKPDGEVSSNLHIYSRNAQNSFSLPIKNLDSDSVFSATSTKETYNAQY